MITAQMISRLLLIVLAPCALSYSQEETPAAVPLKSDFGNHTELGITTGTPTWLNLVVGQWFDQWGVRVSGMTYGANARGIQLFAGFEFIRDENHRHCFGLAGGTWHYTHNDWKFLGPAYDLYIGGFFMEFGIAWGRGTYMANQVLWQFGYTHSIFGK